MDFKDKVVSRFKTIPLRQTMYDGGKRLSKPETQKQSEENIIKCIGNLFILNKEEKEQKQNKDRIIKDRIIRDISNFVISS